MVYQAVRVEEEVKILRERVTRPYVIRTLHISLCLCLEGVKILPLLSPTINEPLFTPRMIKMSMGHCLKGKENRKSRRRTDPNVTLSVTKTHPIVVLNNGY
jgi:hypothetical protein